MDPLNKTLVFGGVGSDRPSLMMWPPSGREANPVVVSEFGYGHSVYALAVSPNGMRIAIGTRNGLLRVYGLVNCKVPENSVPLFEVYHPPFISSLAFLTDDILASGSLNGQIKVWSVSGREKRAVFTAHPTGVLALCRLGSLVLASIGKDAVLRIWDMDTLEERYVSEAFDLPDIRTLISLDYHDQSGLLMHASGSGEVHIYEPEQNFEHHAVPAHQGDFCALACGNEYTVTAGLKDAIIKLWPSTMEEPIAEISAPLGVWSVAWAGTQEVVTAYTDDSSQVWKLDGRLSAGSRYPNFHFRTVIGLPPAMIRRQELQIQRRRCDEGISKVERIITDCGSCKELKQIIDELCENGFPIEACLILTDTVRSQKKPLWELECLLSLVRALDGHSAVLPSLHALAFLLQRLNEPMLAKERFQDILQLDRHYPGISEQLEQLESDPFMVIDPQTHIRTDLDEEKRFLQELEKYLILNKKYMWSCVIQTADRYDCNGQLKPADIVEFISHESEKQGCLDCQIELRELFLFDGNKTRTVTCIYLSSAEKPITIALEICPGLDRTGFIPYEIFDPNRLDIPSDLTASEHNYHLQARWQTIRNSRSIETWLNTMCRVSFEGIKRMLAGGGY